MQVFRIPQSFSLAAESLLACLCQAQRWVPLTYRILNRARELILQLPKDSHEMLGTSTPRSIKNISVGNILLGKLKNKETFYPLCCALDQCQHCCVLTVLLTLKLKHCAIKMKAYIYSTARSFWI